jgi:hypothetical protein
MILFALRSVLGNAGAIRGVRTMYRRGAVDCY